MNLAADQVPMSQEETDLGAAGASARREHERRRAKREAVTRERHPRLGGALLRFQTPPQSERAWHTGAIGEEELARHLSSRCPEALVLHDRRVPGTRANVDHLAVTASGVHVIDAKRYRGKIEVRTPFFGAAKLVINGRDKSKLVAGLAKQRDAVRAALNLEEPEVPVFACFCFLNPAGQAGGSGLPLWRTLSIDGFPLYYPRRLSKRLKQAGALDRGRREELAALLAARLPKA